MSYHHINDGDLTPNTFAQNGDYRRSAGSVAVDNGCIYGSWEDWNLWRLLYLYTTCMYIYLATYTQTHKYTIREPLKHEIVITSFLWQFLWKITILDLGHFTFQPVLAIVQWMQGKRLLATSKTCPSCNAAIVRNPQADISDGCR